MLIASVISATTLAAPLEPLPYSVGVAALDITPSSPIRLNGFGGRTKESAGVRQQIWAKALAIETSDRDTVIVITVDTLGIPDDLTERLAVKLKSRGIDRSRLAICASHTHSGPMIRNCANTLFGQPIAEDQWQTILKYTEELEAKLEEVAVAALADRKPARLSWGIGKVTFAMNRRTKGGPVDHDLPLLAVHDPDGKLRAVFTNYACHCVTLSDDMISGDWAGYAMDHIQRRNPGCQALISVGCGADSNPRGGVLGSRADAADSLGQEIAEEVQRLLSTQLKALTKAPVSLIERVALKLAPLPTREQWEERAKQQNAIGHHARTQLARLDRGEALMTEISYPIQSISFDDELAWVFLPGEVVVDYALRLKRELDGGRLWLNAYANACPGYVPSERILREGGYEGGGAMVYYDIPAPYATGLEQIIVDSVETQLKARIPPAVATAKTNGVPPLAPAEAVASLRTKPGFRTELVVSEPLIESPVAIAFGPDGRLWVAEMNDYPQGRTAGGEPKPEVGPAQSSPPADSPEGSDDGGQIGCVYDDNGDGQYDRSEVFLDGIPFPTGVTVWRNGLLVCAAPDILYAEDTNGDGKADDVRKLFTGFATHNYQARVNSLEYGLDGWVYGSCGLFGGKITSVQTGEVIALSQRDFRFNPDTGVFEPATGSTQQGRVRNDWGDWFGCNNGTMLMHYPLADHYLRRNPYLAPSQTVVGIAAGPEPGRLFSISSQVLFMLSGPPNRPTAACGLGIYRDDLLGSGYSGNAFTCEPVNNLVHRQILVPSGVTFTSRRDDDELDREFLASTDPWFRPVQTRTGPDGALWIVDMYRYVIEHPIWIPPATLATLDPRAGATMGRIYRVFPEGHGVRRLPRLDQLHGVELAAAMDSPNGTQRDLVQQLIQWSNDRNSIPALRQLCVDSVRPEVRIQALWTWANLEPPTAEVILKMLTDSDSHVRSHAVRVAESQLNASAELTAAVIKAADDEDAFLRMQVVYSAGFLKPADSAAVLAKVLAKDGGNGHLKSAVESSLTSANVVQVLNELRAQPDRVDAADRLLVSAATLADPQSHATILKELSIRVTESAAAGHFSRLAQFIDAWSRRSPQDVSPGDSGVHATWKPAIHAALRVAENDESQIQIRIAAVRLLAVAPFLGEPHSESLAALLTPRTPPELQSAAIQALKRDNRPEVADVVLTDWASREPRLRKEGVALLLSRPAWTQRLLAAIEAGTVSAGELDLPQQQALLENAEESIRIAAAKSFTPRTSVGRQQAIDRFTAALQEGGDPGTGRQVFQNIAQIVIGCRTQDIWSVRISRPMVASRFNRC
ncbi:MAG: neutral/alkaline non-lysosomal ceramidase N-terminal domain-containing protein [Planctomycetaceae bacterium]